MSSSTNRRKFIRNAALAGIGFGIVRNASGMSIAPYVFPASAGKIMEGGKVGIIGLDTSHSAEFTKLINASNSGFKVTIAYPKGSSDIESSYSRIPAITEEMKKLGIEIAASLDELIAKCDVVCLETNDGRIHLQQALPVLKAGKRLFIDKPIAASLADAMAIFNASKKYKVSVFSASSLRFSAGLQALTKSETVGKIMGAETYSPCALEKTHPDLFWYGIHGVESLFTLMGTGCTTVVRVYTPGADVVVGTWKDNRIGSFRGTREGAHDYGGTVFGDKAVAPLPAFEGYEPLIERILEFFKTGIVPVSPEETLEICAFMEAADESKKRGGVPVKVADIFKRAEAKQKSF